MLNWIKNLFGASSKQEEAPYKLETPATHVKPKTAAPKKAKKVDLNSMKKDELLAYAKTKKIKVSTSLKKAELILAIKNG